VSGMEIARDGRGVATVWLDNPGRLNALSNRMIHALKAAMDDLAADATCRVVVLRGKNGVFCAGRDLKDLAALQDAPPAEVSAMYDALEAMHWSVQNFPKPLVAAVERYALGIGTMIVAWTDISVAEESAKFGFPEVRKGITPYGAIPTLRRIMPLRAMMDLILSGRTIEAPEAREYGLVSRIAAPGALEARLAAVVDELLAGKPGALERIKRFALDSETLDQRAAVAFATRLAKAGTGDPEAKSGIGGFLKT
jgi:enoyl-CoA hydratase